MIVVDTNVLAYLYLPGEHTARAEALLERDPDWAAPVLWRSELRNVLIGYVRRGTLRLDTARAIQAEAEGLMSGNEHDVASPTVLELAHDTGCSAYDCEFAAVAIALGVKLVTMDAQMLRAFPGSAVALTTQMP